MDSHQREHVFQNVRQPTVNIFNARSPGWLAHILEQRKDNRIFRPKALYVGSEPRPYVPIDDR